MTGDIGERLLAVLERREPPAAFVSEIIATVRAVPSTEVEAALAALDGEERVIVVPHLAPDVHLEAVDLRVVARVPDDRDENAGRAAADAFWDSWLRQFLATHRCE